MTRLLKIGAVIVGAIVITALSIDAADTLTGKSGSMLSQLAGTPNSNGCPTGMIPFSSQSARCVDAFEVSPGEQCPVRAPANLLDSKQNLEVQSCAPESRAGSMPWTNITRDQAMLACARVGKRLPTNAEWYQMALGTPDTTTSECNISSGDVRVIRESSCKSASGAYDSIGNVWEWVSEDVIQGSYNGREVPATGYVSQVDVSGVAVVTEQSENQLFNTDYFWSNKEGAYGMLRGGYYKSDRDAGVYAVHAYTLPTTVGPAIGFRCVQ